MVFSVIIRVLVALHIHLIYYATANELILYFILTLFVFSYFTHNAYKLQYGILGY